MSPRWKCRDRRLAWLGIGLSAVIVALGPIAPASAIEQVDIALPANPYDNPAMWLEERADVVSWTLLGTPVVEVSAEAGPAVAFGAELEALEGTAVRLQGFVFPLDESLEQRHFLLSAVPPTCPFCMPGGPDRLIEIEAAEPVEFTYDPVIVSGKLALLRDDENGLWYRLTEARPVAPD